MKQVLLENEQQIRKWLETINITKYKINPDMSVDVNQTIDLFLKGKHFPDNRLPVQFGTVNGEVILQSLDLVSLAGSPRTVTGDFVCINNNLSTLEGGPDVVGGHYDCDHNELVTLKGAPEKVSGYFSCVGNKLTTLDGISKRIGNHLDISENPITSLAGISKVIKVIDGKLIMRDVKIEGAILGLLRIKGLQSISSNASYSGDLSQALKIVEKHLEDKDVYAAQEEMFEAGLEKFARM